MSDLICQPLQATIRHRISLKLTDTNVRFYKGLLRVIFCYVGFKQSDWLLKRF